ncbi:MAG: SUMF1/EgtB/PvdO family nonheme iron enzyme [Pseudanabaenales cyanobacterium]|nr:SUMF1/EgtB/PvdO family nonheme iron enzyme [Pseudanabaenales cyanobacterium]
MSRNWAITIGVNRYHNQPALNYAQRDAEAVRDFFQTEINCEQVYHFSDDSPPIEMDSGPPITSQPTYRTLSQFLQSRFEDAFLQAGDNFWFFFAGHGCCYKNQGYLMPTDANPDNVEGTAISINSVTERLRRCGADNVVMLIDASRNQACQAGLSIGGETQAGVITFFSCSPNQVSYEIDSLRQGAFTNVLLQGLRLQGAENCATAERLYQYLRYHLPQLNQHYGKPPQTPHVVVESLAQSHLILLPHQATFSDVATLKKDAFSAEAQSDWQLAQQLWIRVLAVSPADPEAIGGIERLAQSCPDSRAAVPLGPPKPKPQPMSSEPVAIPSPSPLAISPASTFEFEVIVMRIKRTGFLGVGKPRIKANRQWKKAEYRTEDLGDGVNLEMIAIPGGAFEMGSPEGKGVPSDERPQHGVTVSSFWMGKYPVTQAQWRTIAALPKVGRELDLDPAKFEGDNCPVENISWYDAVEFCLRLSQKTGQMYRLPSEAEWEYACRAGGATPFHFGETIAPNLANYNGNYTYAHGPRGIYRRQTSPVGNFGIANAFGLYDMHGNVWEWCLDHWHSNYQGAPTDGRAWETGGDDCYRLMRGGSWYYVPGYCRSANRNWANPDHRNNDIGLRLVSVI